MQWMEGGLSEKLRKLGEVGHSLILKMLFLVIFFFSE